MSCSVCIYVFKVPFQTRKKRKKHITGVSGDKIRDWLNLCFGRGAARVQNYDVVAESCMGSRDSVVRAQTLVAHALATGQAERCKARVEGISAGDTMIVKRNWDETAMLLQMTEEDLRKVLPGIFADEVIEVRSRSERKFPGFAMQTMQQSCFLRWGRLPSQGAEVVVPAKLLPSTTGSSIWNGIIKSIPGLDVASLSMACTKARAVVLYMHPDALAANKMVMTHVGMAIPRLLPWEGHCATHNLHLVWRSAAKPFKIEDNFFNLSRVITQPFAAAKITKGVLDAFPQCPVHVGVRPPPNDFNEMVLKYTTHRVLLTMSYLKDVGTPRYDYLEYRRLRAMADEKVELLRRGLNAPWHLDGGVAHYCWGELPGNRCCASVDDARMLVKKALSQVCHLSLDMLKDFFPSRWSGVSRCTSDIALPIFCHSVMKHGLGHSLCSASELRKQRRVVQEMEKAVANGASANDVTGHYRLVRGKRVLSTHDFVKDPASQCKVLAIVVGTVPLDKLFHTLLDGESYAMERSSRDAPVNLLQRMVSEDGDGILKDVHEQLASPVFDAGSILHSVADVTSGLDADSQAGARSIRGTQHFMNC